MLEWFGMVFVVFLFAVTIFLIIDVLGVTVKNITTGMGNSTKFWGLLLEVVWIAITLSLGLYLIGVRF